MEFLALLRKKSVKSAVTGLIIAVVVAAGALVALQLTTGISGLFAPKNLADYKYNDRLEGEYVRFDAEFILDRYAYDNSTAYFIAFAPDFEHFLSLQASNSRAKKLDTESDDQYYGYYYGAYDNEYRAPAVTLYGTLQSMDWQEKKYYKESLDEWGFDSGDGILLNLRVDHFGSTHRYFWYGLLGVLALMLVLSVVRFVGAVTGSHQKALKKLGSGTGGEETSADMLDRWYEKATPVGKAAWMGPDMLVQHTRTKTRVTSLNDVVWAYKRVTRTNGVPTSYTLMLGKQNKKFAQISMKDADVDTALNALMDNCPWIAIGHTPELNRLFRKTPELLRETARVQREGFNANS